jgi:hypothetical protein
MSENPYFTPIAMTLAHPERGGETPSLFEDLEDCE